MKRWLPFVFAALLLLTAAWVTAPASWKSHSPVFRPIAQAPQVASDFAAALCRWDARYLSDHGAGRLAASAEQIQAAAGYAFQSCSAVRYLGSLDSTEEGARYVFVLQVTDRTTHDEVWVITFGPDGKAVGFDWAD